MKASIIWIFPSPWIIPLVNYSAKCKWCNEPSLSPQLACQDTLCLASPMLSDADVFHCGALRLLLSGEAIGVWCLWEAEFIKYSIPYIKIPRLSQNMHRTVSQIGAWMVPSMAHLWAILNSCQTLFMELRIQDTICHHVFKVYNEERLQGAKRNSRLFSWVFLCCFPDSCWKAFVSNQSNKR